MSSLSDKLKSLGVQVGAQNLKPKLHSEHAVEHVVPGRLQETAYGDVFLVDKRIPVDTPHGCRTLRMDAPLDAVAAWANEPRLTQFEPEAFVFLDTETTGLGGSGVYAFMVGVGRYEGDSFRLAQFFMRDPAEEVAMLVALSQFLKPCRALVTFNGRGFDAPILEARYRLNGGDSPLAGLIHLDLLPLARQLWRNRLASRSLSSLEQHILLLSRTQEDVPGWLIPQLYIDYVHSGDARPLNGVFYHNENDIVSMAALLEHIAGQMAAPLRAETHALDIVAMGKMCEGRGQIERAIELYRQGMARGLPEEAHLNTVERLSLIYKRNEAWAEAIELWQAAASRGHLYAHVELAKFYEHHERDYDRAMHWTQAAIECVRVPDRPHWERDQQVQELEHRLSRLKRKSGR